MYRVSKEFKDSMTAWLDAESAYRLSVQKAKEAKEGAKFAEEEYEKYREAQKEAKENFEAGKKKHDQER